MLRTIILIVTVLSYNQILALSDSQMTSRLLNQSSVKSTQKRRHLNENASNSKSKSFKAPWDISTGYINFTSKSTKYNVFYSLWKAPKNDKTGTNKNQNRPLVIGNPGGPGVAPESLAFSSGGAFTLNPENPNGLEKTDSDKTYFTFADVLIPDIPSGTSVSSVSNFNTNIEDSLKDILTFFEKLDEKIHLKNRNIYWYGISYGSGLGVYIASHLKERGWNIKGLLLDSPWISPYWEAKKFSKVMLKYKVMRRKTKFFKKWKKIAKNCYKHVLIGKKGFSKRIARQCDSLWNSLYPYQHRNNISGYCLKAGIQDPKIDEGEQNMMAGNKNKKSSSDDDEKIMGGFKKYFFGHEFKKSGFMTPTVYDQLQVFGFWYDFQPYFEKLYNQKIPMTLLNGYYDGITGPDITKAWLTTIKKIKSKVHTAHWKKTKHGFIGNLGNNFIYERIHKACHAIGETHPQTVVNAMHNLIKNS